MTKTLLAVLLGGSLLCAAEAKTPLPPKPSDVCRTVTVGEKTVVPVRTSVLESTMIVLPEGEKVTSTFGGDTENWKIQSTHAPSRYISVKPTAPGVSTNLHVITDHDNDYSFMLSEASGTGERFDVKIFLEASDDVKKNLEKPAAFVSADEVAKIRREAEEAKVSAVAEAQKAQVKAQSDAQAFQSSYPAKLHFDYSWSATAGKKLGIEQIFRDEKFTYIRATPQEAPALYEIKDGKPSLIQFDFANGLYTVPKLLDAGYLAVGKQKVEFRRINN